MTLVTTTTVYLLEQDTGVTDTVHSLCTEKALTLECFQSSSDLVTAVESIIPACVIAANDQPTGQAIDLLEQLESRKIKVPVIILGHHSDVASAVAAIKGGAIDYIEKPVVYGRLAEHFSQFIEGSRNTTNNSKNLATPVT